MEQQLPKDPIEDMPVFLVPLRNRLKELLAQPMFENAVLEAWTKAGLPGIGPNRKGDPTYDEWRRMNDLLTEWEEPASKEDREELKTRFDLEFPQPDRFLAAQQLEMLGVIVTSLLLTKGQVAQAHWLLTNRELWMADTPDTEDLEPKPKPQLTLVADPPVPADHEVHEVLKGTITDVMKWVTVEPLTRAKIAANAELGRGDKARKSLVEKLLKIGTGSTVVKKKEEASPATDKPLASIPDGTRWVMVLGIEGVEFEGIVDLGKLDFL